MLRDLTERIVIASKGRFDRALTPGTPRPKPTVDTLWKALGKAAVLHEARRGIPLVLLTTDAPTKGSAGDAALRVVLGPGKAIYDVVELLSAEGQERLHRNATDGPSS